jgi:hypothetical protein
MNLIFSTQEVNKLKSHDMYPLQNYLNKFEILHKPAANSQFIRHSKINNIGLYETSCCLSFTIEINTSTIISSTV